MDGRHCLQLRKTVHMHSLVVIPLSFLYLFSDLVPPLHLGKIGSLHGSFPSDDLSLRKIWLILDYVVIVASDIREHTNSKLCLKS